MWSISSQGVAVGGAVLSLMLVLGSEGLLGVSAGVNDPVACAGIIVWLVSPYLMLFILAQRSALYRGGGIIVLIGSVAISLFGIFVLSEPTSHTMWTIDLSGDLVVVVLPALQWAALVALGVFHSLVRGKACSPLPGNAG